MLHHSCLLLADFNPLHMGIKKKINNSFRQAWLCRIPPFFFYHKMLLIQLFLTSNSRNTFHDRIFPGIFYLIRKETIITIKTRLLFTEISPFTRSRFAKLMLLRKKSAHEVWRHTFFIIEPTNHSWAERLPSNQRRDKLRHVFFIHKRNIGILHHRMFVFAFLFI